MTPEIPSKELSTELNLAQPYIVKHMLRITISPPAANDHAAPAYSVFLSGPVGLPTVAQGLSQPRAPVSSGLTAVLLAGELEIRSSSSSHFHCFW